MNFILAMEEEYMHCMNNPTIVKRTAASEIALLPAWPSYWFLREVFHSDESIRDSVKYSSKDAALDAARNSSVEWLSEC